MAADPSQLQDAAAAAIMRLLNDFRLQVIGAILAHKEPLSSTYRQILAEVNTLIVTYQRQTTATLVRLVTDAAQQGDAAVIADAQAAGIDVPLSYVGVSDQLVRTAAEYSASLVTNLTAEARSAIEREVRLAALGGKTTMQLIDAIGKNLTDKSVFTTIAARAEAIARTEVSRVYSMSHWDQASQLGARYPGIRRIWVHAGFGKYARANHEATAAATAANPIPWNQPFDLGNGIQARYPHDPALPASEVINCRCVVRLLAPQRDGQQGQQPPQLAQAQQAAGGD